MGGGGGDDERICRIGDGRIVMGVMKKRAICELGTEDCDRW